MSADLDDDLTEEQFHRYARHLILDEVGDEGQAKLLASRVLVIGAGGLGAPVAFYLAAAGIGTLGLADDDEVDLTNLQRQIIHTTEAVGTPKLESALARLRALNPGIDYRPHATRLTAANAEEIVAGYDLVVDGSDNFTTRYLANDICHRLGKTLVSGALLRFEGQLSVFRSGLPGHETEPCYRCLFREPPDPSLVPRCEEAGILGAVAGVIGTLQATEVLKELLGLGDSLSGRLLLYDALGTEFRTVRFKKDPTCPTCGGV